MKRAPSFSGAIKQKKYSKPGAGGAGVYIAITAIFRFQFFSSVFYILRSPSNNGQKISLRCDDTKEKPDECRVIEAANGEYSFLKPQAASPD